jgi:hypothetical protein
MQGFNNSTYVCKYKMDLVLEIADKEGRTHQKKNRFYIGDLGNTNIVLGMDWLIEHNPKIDWKKYTVKMTRCPERCCTQLPITIRANLDLISNIQMVQTKVWRLNTKTRVEKPKAEMQEEQDLEEEEMKI